MHLLIVESVSLVLSGSPCMSCSTTVTPPLSLPTSRAAFFGWAPLPHAEIILTTVCVPGTLTFGAFTLQKPPLTPLSPLTGMGLKLVP